MPVVEGRDTGVLEKFLGIPHHLNQQAVSRGMPPTDPGERIKAILMPKMVEKKWYPYASQFENKEK